MNGYTFRRLDSRSGGRIPDHTCPDIDDIIDTLEGLRKANQQLRDAAEYWKGECESIADERDDLENKLNDAQSDISYLQKELEKKDEKV